MLDWDTRNTDSVQSILDSFSGVWERVRAAPDDGPSRRTQPEASFDTERMDLRTLSIHAAEAAMYDRALSCRCRGAVRTVLQQHAAQASHRAASLRGEYFVRTGETVCPPEICPRLEEPLTALREGMLRDRASADSYRRLAAQTDDAELSSLLERFSRETAAASDEKRRSILRCFI